MMRLFLAGTLALMGLTALAATRPAQAQEEAPWCAVHSGMYGAYWDCQYWTLKACVPNILAGNRGFCNPNPAYSGPMPGRRTYHRRHWRR